MSVLRNLEAKLEGLVEGAFSRAFRSQVQPVELARKLAEFLLSPQAQAAALEFGNQIPSNLKTQPSSPVAQATVDRFKAYMKTVVTLDWDSVNQLRPEWNARWNKSIER